MILLAPDVLLDVLLARAPHADAAARLLDRIVRGDLEATTSAESVALAWQVAVRAVGAAQARGIIEQLVAIVPVTPLAATALLEATASPIADADAAILHAVAHEAQATAIIT
ncbi:MAG: hypothetical protein MUF21_02365, partial [Gemmatimonadaceae bacterium]|nr:hypothetical protein [Gemmatimonadaceae bacterium]